MFSVIVPVHNKLPHLDRSIKSVLNQTFKEFELILVDDASTDGSFEKIKEYNDQRIRIFKRNTPGPGGYAARNIGIENAKHDWIAFLDADDEWNVNYLSVISEYIYRNSDVELLSTNWIKKKEGKDFNPTIINHSSGEEHIEFSLTDYLNNPLYVCTGAVTVHKKIIARAGNFPDQGKCKRGGDVDTWIRWLHASNKSIHIDKILFYYYRDTVNRVTSKPNRLFCAYNILIQIYNNETDRKLKKAVRSFINRFVYNMLARQVRSGMPIDYNEIKKMYLNTYSILRVLKLHHLRLKYFLKS